MRAKLVLFFLVSAFSLNGHLGQYVLVSPAQGLTLVRLGQTPDGNHAPVRAALGRIAALFPPGARP